METKFKVGDKVLLNKPKYKYNNAIIWQKEMERYVGDIFEVVSVNADSKLYYCDGKYINNWFHESWLTKIEEQVTEQVIEQVTEQVAKPIDWEQRRWDLYKMFLGHYPDYSIGEALNAADRCVEFYKQKKQN